MTTERLYYADSYLAAFHATIRDRSADGRRLILDRTAFYPTSGGQPHDLGRLGGAAILDVIDEGDEVVHVLDQPVAGDAIDGRVDWGRRLDHMQQHTGQHLLSAVLAELFGIETVSVHFGDRYATLDLDTGHLGAEQLRQAEARANAVATENRVVSVGFEDAATATGLRKASAREGTLRIVTIAGLDRSACGGTHVRATGEIGPILIRGMERVKKQVRLEFRCGARAVARARADADALAAMATATSTGVDDLPAQLAKQREEFATLLADRRRLEGALHAYRAGELYHAATAGPDGLRLITLADPGMTMESTRGLAQALIALPRVVVVGTLATPPAILYATSADSGIDAGQRLRALLAERGGRGGGSPRMAQGTAPDAAGLADVARLLTGSPEPA